MKVDGFLPEHDVIKGIPQSTSRCSSVLAIWWSALIQEYLRESRIEVWFSEKSVNLLTVGVCEDGG